MNTTTNRLIHMSKRHLPHTTICPWYKPGAVENAAEVDFPHLLNSGQADGETTHDEVMQWWHKNTYQFSEGMLTKIHI